MLVAHARDASETWKNRKIHSFEVAIQEDQFALINADEWSDPGLGLSVVRDAFKMLKRQFEQLKYSDAVDASRVFGKCSTVLPRPRC